MKCKPPKSIEYNTNAMVTRFANDVLVIKAPITKQTPPDTILNIIRSSRNQKK